MAAIDLGKTIVTDKIRVSSAAIFMSAHFGKYTQYETWIFSDDPKQKNHQIIHGTSPGYELFEIYVKEAIKVHDYISGNLLKKLF